MAALSEYSEFRIANAALAASIAFFSGTKGRILSKGVGISRRGLLLGDQLCLLAVGSFFLAIDSTQCRTRSFGLDRGDDLAEVKNHSLFLRAADVTPEGRQLPLSTDRMHFLAGLEIGAVDEALGTVLIAAAGLPPIASPVFRQGAILYVPRRGAEPAATPLTVVEPEVLAFMTGQKMPLNKDTDTTKVNKEEDDPTAIPQFLPPCKSYKMIGVYESAAHQTAQFYRPAGLCKMRNSSDEGTGDGEFCHVCKWLIVNRVNPGLHAILDEKYYPTAKGPVQDPQFPQFPDV